MRLERSLGGDRNLNRRSIHRIRKPLIASYASSVDFSRGNIAAIALGSNLGDRHAYLARALVGIAAIPRTRVLKRSSIIETKPEPITPIPSKPEISASTDPLGGPYLNGAALLWTMLDAAALFDELRRIERSLGRERDPANQASPRVIDLDLLTFGDRVIQTPELTVPHPRMHLRTFVLGPLAEIAPNLVVPGIGVNVQQLRERLSET